MNLAAARLDLADATSENPVIREIQRAFRKVVIGLNPTPDERVMTKTICASLKNMFSCKINSFEFKINFLGFFKIVWRFQEQLAIFENVVFGLEGSKVLVITSRTCQLT